VLKVIHGDCVKEMAKLHPSSIDAIVCDPPYWGTALKPAFEPAVLGLACQAEGFDFVGIEKEAEYLAIARKRLGLD